MNFADLLKLCYLAMEERAQQRMERKKALDEKKRKAEEEKLVCCAAMEYVFKYIFIIQL